MSNTSNTTTQKVTTKSGKTVNVRVFGAAGTGYFARLVARNGRVIGETRVFAFRERAIEAGAASAAALA